MSQLDELIDDWRAGRRDLTLRQHLGQALRQADEEERRRFWQTCEEEWLLHDLVGEASRADVELAHAFRPTASARWRLPALAAAAALLIGLVVWRQTRPMAVVVELQAGGAVYRSDAIMPLADDAGLQVGDRLQLASDGRLTMRWPGGHRLDCGPATTLHLRSADELHLLQGRIDFLSDEHSTATSLHITTPHADARIGRASGSLRVDRYHSSLSLRDGRLQWRDDAGVQTASAPASLDAGEAVLIGFDCSRGRVESYGRLGAGLGLQNHEPHEFTDAGLLLERDDLTTWTGPNRHHHPQLLADLQAADRVALTARIRFRHDPPIRCGIATLICMQASDPAHRFLPLWWRGPGPSAGPRWYEIRVSQTRDGQRITSVDGEIVDRRAAPWPFDSWGPFIDLRVHTHQDTETRPLDIVYARLSISTDR